MDSLNFFNFNNNQSLNLMTESMQSATPSVEVESTSSTTLLGKINDFGNFAITPGSAVQGNESKKRKRSIKKLQSDNRLAHLSTRPTSYAKRATKEERGQILEMGDTLNDKFSNKTEKWKYITSIINNNRETKLSDSTVRSIYDTDKNKMDWGNNEVAYDSNRNAEKAVNKNAHFPKTSASALDSFDNFQMSQERELGDSMPQGFPEIIPFLEFSTIEGETPSRVDPIEENSSSVDTIEEAHPPEINEEEIQLESIQDPEMENFTKRKVRAESTTLAERNRMRALAHQYKVEKKVEVISKEIWQVLARESSKGKAVPISGQRFRNICGITYSKGEGFDPSKVHEYLENIEDSTISSRISVDEKVTETIWSEAEDLKLIQLVSEYNESKSKDYLNKWKNFGLELKKPEIDCIKRFNIISQEERAIDLLKNQRKKFTNEENLLLVSLVEKHKDKTYKWNDITEEMNEGKIFKLTTEQVYNHWNAIKEK